MFGEHWLNSLDNLAIEAILAMDLNHRGFQEATTPLAVRRLVAMVRALARGCDCDAETCMDGCTPECLINMAYSATEHIAD